MELWECETVEDIAGWLLRNSEYYFELALEEAQEIHDAGLFRTPPEEQTS